MAIKRVITCGANNRDIELEEHIMRGQRVIKLYDIQIRPGGKVGSEGGHRTVRSGGVGCTQPMLKALFVCL